MMSAKDPVDLLTLAKPLPMETIRVDPETQRLLSFLLEQQIFQPDELQLLVSVWQNDGQQSEGLLDWLVREHLCDLTAARTLRQLAKGYLAASACTGVLSAAFRKRCLAFIKLSYPDLLPTDPITQFQSHFHEIVDSQSDRPTRRLDDSQVEPEPQLAPSTKSLSEPRSTGLRSAVETLRIADETMFSAQIRDLLLQLPAGRLKEIELLRPLGSTSISERFLARQVVTQQFLSLRLFTPNFFIQDRSRLETFLKRRFAIPPDAHPQLLTPATPECSGRFLFYTTPYCPTTLAEQVTGPGGVPALIATIWMAQAAVGIRFAHEQGVVHGNLNRTNILLDEQSQIKVTDFGNLEVLEAATWLDIRCLALLYAWLMTGVWPVAESPTQSFWSQLLQPTVPPLAHWNLTSVFPAARQIIQRGLLAGQTDGYQTTAELADALHQAAQQLSLGANQLPGRWQAALATWQRTISTATQLQPQAAPPNTVSPELQSLAKPIPVDLSVTDVSAPNQPNTATPINADLTMPVPAPDFAAKLTQARPSSRLQFSLTGNADVSVTNELAARSFIPSVGMVLGKCLLTEQVGKGGFAWIFRAIHTTLNISVAVKILQSEVLTNNWQVYQRFVSEAQLLAQLNHPNVVRVLDFDDDPSLPYLVLEFVEGLSLAELIGHSGRVRIDRSVDMIIQAADGLAAAQRLGVVHRDVTPSNILLARDGIVKLADFGLAILEGEQHLPKSDEAKEEKSSSADNLVWGTAAYMSPEQASQKPLDFRSDIYSLGATLYHALTGQPPFRGTAMEMMIQHVTELPRSPCELVPDLPPKLAALILKMLAKNPKERFENYQSLINNLLDFKTGQNFSTHSNSSRVRGTWRSLLGFG